MKLKDLIEKKIVPSKNILISTHLFPDADGIGSQIALCEALIHQGKNAICVNEEPLLERYSYLDPNHRVLGWSEFQKLPSIKWDLSIIVDTNKEDRVGKNIQHFITPNIPVLFIDHHPYPHQDPQKHCIRTESAATGQIIGELIEMMGIAFTQEMALALYTSILIDTSSFRYPTVTAQTHALIAKLLATGIHPHDAYNGIYGTKKIEHMHLLGQILSSSSTNPRRDVAWIEFSFKDIAHFGSDIEDTHAFINHLLILENIRVACMFRDDGEKVKVSFRSTGEYDVGTIAAALGGGGHSHSAATVITKTEGKGRPEIISRVIKKIEEMIDAQLV